MTAPFRDAETSALIHAEKLEAENEQLERENQKLREEVRRLKDSVGENRDAYITNIEDQLKATKSDLSRLKGEREWKPTRTPPVKVDAQTGVVLGAVGVVSFIIWLIFALIAQLRK